MDADVIVVGYGPVGQVLATLLALAGHRVLVAEQQPAPFAQPRAVAVDGYAARVLALTGIAPVLAQIGEPTPDYVVENAQGATLMRLELANQGRNGWPESTSIYQPGLEAAMEARGREIDTLQVLRGHRAVGLSQDEGAVTVNLRIVATGESRELTARWLVGCDGANSTVRETIGTPVTDYGFAVDWMACDVVALGEPPFAPRTLHVADPACPRVSVSAGPGHYRFEFLRLDTESPAQFNTEPTAWRRLARFGITPDRARLDRYAVYRIRARCAERWRAGRLLIAGDAAHEMPPFAGQGLSSGIGDAANLAWKLHAVLGGASERIIDSYGEERMPRVRRAIDTSVRLGNVICTTQPAAAAARDTAMLRMAGRPAPSAPDALSRGLLARTPAGPPARFAGRLTPQARVAINGTTGGLDDLVGSGRAHILLLSGDAHGADSSELERLGVRVVRVTPDGPAGPPDTGGCCVRDVDGVYMPWLESLGGARAALVRPDFYVFGVGHDTQGVRALVADLAAQLEG